MARPRAAGSDDRRPEAFELALRALARKERTTAELAGWLAGRGCEPGEIEATLIRLAELGELDDERFARRYAEDKRELRGWGPDRIRDSLAARGLPHDLIEAALSAESAPDQIARATELLARRGEPIEGERDRGRALAYLTRRGFDYEIAYAAVRAQANRAA